VGSLGRRDDGRIGDKRKVDTRVRNQVGLELVEIDVQRAVEPQGGGDGRNNYSQLANLHITTCRSARSLPWAMSLFRFS
jgi:hypothetical protein